MVMTPEFQKVYDQINNSNIQLILLKDYYNDVDKAEKALFVEKIMQEAIEKQNAILQQLQEDNIFIKDQLQKILKYF